MSLRSFLVAALSISFLPAVQVLAQDSVQPPTVENSKYHFEGVINTSAVYVRSGPGEGYYSTQKLDKGATVVVVGIKFDWLKIEPPAGSFCYVGRAYVDLTADGKTGKINGNEVNIRAGSELNEMKTTVPTHMNQGDLVEVLGQEDQYLKIKPPPGAYFYVNKQFVDATRALADVSTPALASAGNTNPLAAVAPATQPTVALAQPKPQTNQLPPAGASPQIIPDPSAPLLAAAAPTTQPMISETPTTQPAVLAAVVPSTQPVVVVPSADELFGKYDNEFADMSKQPLGDQKIEELTSEFKSIQKASDLSPRLKDIVDLRIATLQVRAESQTKLLDLQKTEQAAADRHRDLIVEQNELETRLKSTQVISYTALGTLRPSSLQLGGETLYRLTDPGTGRTVVYLRTSDAKAADLMDKFIGVNGNPTVDSQLSLRVISPTDMKEVDPANVNGSVTAELIPPSLLAHQAALVNTGAN